MKTGWNGRIKKALVAGALLTVSTVGVAVAAWTQHDSSEKAMMTGKNGWSVDAKFTVGEMIGGYRPIGILDGIGAYRKGRRVRVLVNHEVGQNLGHAYPLANGTYLTGSRVSLFEFDRSTRVICDAGPAFDTIYDRHGKIVTDPAQVNETGKGIEGLSRLCSSQLVTRRDGFGFRDTIYLTGEETGKPFHPHGGTEWALDVDTNTLWACPDLGRGAWENVTPIATGQRNKVALLLGDDTQSAPLYLYVGTANPRSEDFLERNGLKGGKLYAWKADNGDLDPEDWNGTGTSRDGTFVEVTVKDTSKANTSGYDSQGYADIDTLQNEADALGCFSFSRPEDLATNPDAKNQAAFASTGRGSLYPSDDWGTVYVVIVKFESNGAIKGRLEIIYDGDDAGNEDNGLRSPDNLDWADDGYIYVCEDRSTSNGTFGGTSNREASIWRLDPRDSSLQHVAEMDRSAVVPASITADRSPNDLGNWESSGVLDVTDLFHAASGERILIADVQAHSVSDLDTYDGPDADSAPDKPGSPIRDDDLVEGGQLILLSKGGSND